MRRGKKYAAAAAKYDKQKRYELNEAVKLVKEAAFAKFDETVELSVKLNLKKGQSVRDTVVLPNQFAAEKRILVFAKGEKATEAAQAGAAYVRLARFRRCRCDSRYDEGRRTAGARSGTPRDHAEPENRYRHHGRRRGH